MSFDSRCIGASALCVFALSVLACSEEPAPPPEVAQRLRPVAMAASTTALGMLPLLGDAFFVAMAVTIIFGLLFATVLTMVVLPVCYAILFQIPADD